MLLGVPLLGSAIRIPWAKMAIFNLYTRKYIELLTISFDW